LNPSEIANNKAAQIELLKTASAEIKNLKRTSDIFDYIIEEIELGKVASMGDVLNLKKELSESTDIEFYKKARDMNFSYEESSLVETSEETNNSTGSSYEEAVQKIKEI
jgi:hypothetical protein